MMEPLLQECQQAEDDWLFSQINQLFKRINESNIQIENEDLYQFSVLETNCYEILKEIKIHLQSQHKTYYHCIVSLLQKRTLIIIYYGTIINLCQLIILVLLDLITNILKETNIQKFLLLTYFMTMIIASILKTYVQSKEQREINLFLIRIRILINHLVFTKALRIQNICVQFNQPENIVNANTLITTDIEELMYVQYCIKDVWTGIILITGAMLILAQKDLYSTMIVFSSLFISLILNGIIVYYNIYADEQMMNYKDKRVELTTIVLGCMKQIKQLVWEENFSNKIQQIRKIEFKYITLLKVLDGVSRAFWMNISNVLLFIFVSSSLNNQKTLIDLNVFTLIAIFNTLRFPLGIFPWCVNCGVCFKVSFQRICKYLEYQEVNQKDRIILPNIETSNQILICKDMIFSWPQNNIIESEPQAKTQVQIIDLPEQQFTLRVDDLSIQQNTLNFVIGQIGSGKSALFNAILNEMSSNQIHQKQERSYSLTSAESLLSIDERIIIKGSIAYCSQNTWVQNDTIQANILFGKQFESNLYNQVIDVCQIYKDLMQFEKKDLHVIGPEGKNLSGGQKQRITLARALYQDADIYLLDDIFSSLDVHVADTIFQKAIIQYLIGKGKTVLLITSHYRYLRQVPQYVNSTIIYLNNGILEHNYEIIKQFIQIQTQQEHDNLEQSEILKEKDEECKDQLPIQSDMVQDDIESDNLEERHYNKFNTQVFRYYLSSMGFCLVFLTFFILIAMQGSMSLLDFWLREELTTQKGWLHEITIYFNNSFGESFTFLTLLSISITLIKSAICVAWSLKAAKCIFDKLNSILMASNCAFYDKNNIGRIINRIQGDTKSVDDELPYVYMEFTDNLTKALTLSIALMILFPYFLLVFIIVIFCYYSISKFYAKSNREIKRLQKANQGNLLQTLNETLTGITVIRAFNKQSYFEDTFYKKLFKQIVSFQCGERSSYWLDVRLNLMSNLIIICVISIIYLSVLAESSINYNTYALALTYSVLILESCFNISYQYLEFEQLLVSVERIQQYHQNPVEQIDTKQIIKNEQPNSSDISVKFIDVSLSYDGKSALKNFTLSIKQGEKVAFVGRTGSGKTSILNVLFGLYPHQFGSIEINGKNTKHMSLRELRKEMSVVPQFGFLYNATVKDNLDPLGNVSKEEIENLFRETGFNLRGISDLQSGYNTDFMIQQNGANLSNGEKQVLNFMRIMLLNKSIVCLDEATSNMDPKTDQLLHDLLFKYVQNRTLLVITHRLENIAIYDKIVVMEQGQIVEYGSYSELLSNEGGFLYKLVQNHHQKI